MEQIDSRKTQVNTSKFNMKTHVKLDKVSNTAKIILLIWNKIHKAYKCSILLCNYFHTA